MRRLDGKLSICKVIVVQVLLLLFTMSEAEDPWEKLKIRQFCLPSTYYVEIKKEGCTPEMIKVNACLGVCPSYVKIISQKPFFKQFCHCCTATESEKVEFTLKNCKNRQDNAVLIESAKKCSCLNINCN